MSTMPPAIPQPETTGRYLVLLNDEAIDSGIQTLSDRAGVHDFAHTADFSDSAPSPDVLVSEQPLVFDELGVAVVDLDPNQLQSVNMAVASTTSLMTVEPERVVYALSDGGMQPDKREALEEGATLNISVGYLKGYRDAINNLVDHLIPAADLAAGEAAEVAQISDPGFTWGLLRTRTNTSGRSGLGIRVAVLDTGFDLKHPDFLGRMMISKSFIEGETAQDGNGHGTHCIGTACGPQNPSVLPRYGVAYNAEIYAGKVLSDAGSGADGGILAGINWAIANECAVISMSLGAPTAPGQSYSKVYEQVAQRALQRGSLIIAAAGNDSNRSFGQIAPVSHPANCPSIMAVAAIDNRLRVAPFSNGGINSEGGQVDIAAPGVDVYSAWPMPTRYNTISGTSMATPHVSGIAALYAEATGARGQVLWSQLIRNSRRLWLRSRDVGVGLVQAIQ